MRPAKAFIAICALFSLRIAWAQPAGEWHEKTAMPTPRQELPIAFLNGKIYAAGGLEANATSTKIEIYDPALDSWSTGGPLPVAMHHHHMVAVNGKLYILGGFEGPTFSNSGPSNRVLEFDPETREWNEKERMPTSRGAGVAVAFDGKIFVIGGQFGLNERNDNEMYNPLTDEWTQRTPMPTAREHLSGARIDSLLYIVGGRRRLTLENFPTLEAYSPASDRWYSLESMPTPRGGLAAASLNGQLYVFGGEFFDLEDGNSGIFSETEAYDPATHTWTTLTDMKFPRHGMGAVAVGDSIFVIGGGTVAGLDVSNKNTVFIPPANTTHVQDDESVPATFSLAQNFPNPFNPSTAITFSLPGDYRVQLTVYDLSGHRVAELVNAQLGPGDHSVTWQAARHASGVYFYRLEAHAVNALHTTFSQSKKMLLVR